MSYQSVVLSKHPIYYARLDELSGSDITDYSGNNYTATFLPGAVKGIGSPILTDPASYAVGKGISANVSAPAPTGAFSYGGWAYAVHGVDVVIVSRNGQAGVAGGNHIYIDGGGGAIRANIANSAADIGLSYSVPQWNTWYRVLLVRNGVACQMYVNGVLVASSTSFSAAAMDGAYVSAGHWNIGCFSSGLINLDGANDEIDIYSTALTAADELAIYEASQPTLPLRATITINVGLELNTDQITPTNLGFAHNYAATFGDGQVPITEELEYKTNINQSEPDYQQRINARPHGALRSLEYHLSPASGNARARFQGSLYLPGQFYTLPVWSDYGLTTGSAGSGTNTIPLDTTLRDYEPLSYCGACTDPSDPLTYQFFQIISVSDSALTLGSNIGTTIPSGSYVFPARISTISADSLAIKSFAADHEDSVIRFDVIESELSSRRITTYTPSTTYRSIEVFTLESAKVSFLDERPYDMARRIQAHGRDYQYAMDTGSPQTFPVRFLLTSRALLSQFYGWLDARQGKQNPLWVSTKENDLIKVAQPGSGVLKIKSGYTTYNLQQGRRDVQMTYSDGSLVNSRITAVVDNLDGTETISLDTLPAGTVSKISWLKLVTLASDTVQLKHWKGGVSECALSFKDLLTTT